MPRLQRSLNGPSLWSALTFLVLVAVMSVAPGAARAADDCASVTRTCLREAFWTKDNQRTLAVTLLRQYDKITHYNVIIEGRGQFEVEPGEGFTMAIPDNGQAVYSAQACRLSMSPANYMCETWKQVVRQFPPLSECNHYANTAVALLLQSYGYGCGFKGGFWTDDSQAHLKFCLGLGSDYLNVLREHTSARDREYRACVANVEAAARANRPVKTTGRPKDGSGTGAKADTGWLTCSGGGMNVQIKNTSVLINFEPAAQPAEQATPGAGQCAWSDRAFKEGESKRIAFSTSKDKADDLIMAARKGGTFVVAGTSMMAFIMVSEIAEVNGAGGAPPAQPDEVVEVPEEGEPAPPPGNAQSAECPVGPATVSVASVGEEVLNVRNRAKDGDVIAQVPDGSEVSVVGACLAGGAGFAKGKTLKPNGNAGGNAGGGDQGAAGAGNGWCRISQPHQGCVSAKFLAFDAAPMQGGAGFAKGKTLKPVDNDGAGKKKATQAVAFTGNWTVAGDDGTGYTMKMTQKGASVSGSWNGDDGSKGTFKGNVKGNVLRFAWKQADGYSGSGKFVLAGDGSSFDGSYNFGKNPDQVEGSWSGNRR